MDILHPSSNVAGVPQKYVDRFLSYFDIPEDPEACWAWKGAIGRDGYGRYQFLYSPLNAHRFSYMLSVGPIESGRQVHHLCENRACVNPAHLRQLTPKEHAAAQPSHPGNRKACKRGHEFTPENTYVYRGLRSCRQCKRESVKKKLGYENVPPFSSLYCKEGHPLFGENMRLIRHPTGTMVRKCMECNRRRANEYHRRHRDRVLASKNKSHDKERADRQAKRIAALRDLATRIDEMNDATVLEEFSKAVKLDPAP